VNPEIVELAEYRLGKAKNTLADAKMFFIEASSASIVNRIYYALFYAVSALLATGEYTSSKHSGVRSIFNRDFVKTGLVDFENGKFYSELFDARQEGDYKDFIEFQKEDVAIWLEKAEGFLSAIERLVKSRLLE
jgi:uncharacterized protein (UPF0332 family)